MAGGANSDDHIIGAVDSRDVEVTGGGVVSYVAEDAFSGGFCRDLGIHRANVRGGKG